MLRSIILRSIMLSIILHPFIETFYNKNLDIRSNYLLQIFVRPQYDGSMEEECPLLSAAFDMVDGSVFCNW